MRSNNDPLAQTRLDEPGLFGTVSTPVRPPYGGVVPLPSASTDTQREAAARIAPTVGTLRARVLGLIVEAGVAGMTAVELTAVVAGDRGVHPENSRVRNAVAPRTTELKLAGFIEDGGERRGGCICWRATEAGRSAAL